MSDSILNHYDVAIIGAGPVGVTAANLLGRYGVHTLLIDREPDIIDIPRAVALCEEGSRVLAAAGVLERLEGHLRPIKRVVFADKNQRPMMFADVDQIQNGYPATRTFHQPDMEKKMRENLKQFPSIDFFTSTELTTFVDHDDHITLTLVREGKQIKTSATYLLACDGAKSQIRKKLGIGFGGATYPQDWLIVDVEEAPPADDEVVFSINPERPAVTLPGPGTKRRWEFVVKDDDDIETLTDSNTIQKLLEPWIDGQDVQISRKAIYRFHARSAETYHKGNVFLLGDAAHITPPFAGQGMMAGLRDAYNIAWKLVAVINKRLPDAILNSYDTERRPQNIQVTRFAQYMGYFILPQKAIPAAFRDGVIRFLRLIGLHSDTKPLQLEKIPNHINGRFMRNAIVQRFGLTGVEFPQCTVEKEDGSTRLFDHFIGDQFTILSWEEDAGQWLDGTTKERWKQLGGQTKVISQQPQNSLNADLLIDRSGQYADLFHHGQRVVVIRPDKMMVIHCRPAQLNQKLTRYLNSIGAPQVDQMSQNQRLTIAQ